MSLSELGRAVSCTTYSTLPDSIPDQPESLLHILQLDSLREPHPSVRLRQPDHTLQLTSRGGNSLLLGSNVLADLSHLHVGLDEGI